MGAFAKREGAIENRKAPVLRVDLANSELAGQMAWGWWRSLVVVKIRRFFLLLGRVGGWGGVQSLERKEEGGFRSGRDYHSKDPPKRGAEE